MGRAAFLILIAATFAAEAGGWQRFEGQRFALDLPAAWRLTEAPRGFEVEGPGGAMFLTVRGVSGAVGPRGCLREAARRRAPLAPVQTLKLRAPQPGPVAFTWRVAEGELAVERGGRPFRLRLRCAVLDAPGQRTEVLRGDYLPQHGQAAAEVTLATIRASLRLRHPAALGGLQPAALPDRDRAYDETESAAFSSVTTSAGSSDSNGSGLKVISPPPSSYQESPEVQSGKANPP